jgi:hypothetical protein
MQIKEKKRNLVCRKEKKRDGREKRGGKKEFLDIRRRF